MKGHIQLLKHGKEVSLRNFADKFQFEKRLHEMKAHAAITFEPNTAFEIVAVVEDSLVNSGDLRSMKERVHRKSRITLRQK